MQAADAFKAMEDGPTKAADAVALFGKAGLNMIPFLNKGREGVEEFEDAVNVFGPKITKQGIEATENWKTSVEKLSLAWDGLKVNLTEEILPRLLSRPRSQDLFEDSMLEAQSLQPSVQPRAAIALPAHSLDSSPENRRNRRSERRRPQSRTE